MSYCTVHTSTKALSVLPVYSKCVLRRCLNGFFIPIDDNLQSSVELLRQALLYLYHWSRHHSSWNWTNHDGMLTWGETWHSSTHTPLVTEVSNQLCDFVIAIDRRAVYTHTYTDIHTHAQTQYGLSVMTNYRTWETVIVQKSLYQPVDIPVSSPSSDGRILISGLWGMFGNTS